MMQVILLALQALSLILSTLQTNHAKKNKNSLKTQNS